MRVFARFAPVMIMMSAVLTVAACGYSPLGSDRGAKAAPAGRAGETLVAALDLLPDGTGMVVSVDMSALTDRAFVELGRLLGLDGQKDPSRMDMGDLIRKEMGIDLLNTDTLVVFELDNEFAVLVPGTVPVSGFPHPLHKEHSGMPLLVTKRNMWVATLSKHTVVGSLPIVKAVIDAGKKKGKTVSTGKSGKRFLEMAQAVGEGYLVAVMDSSKLGDLPELLPGAKVDGVGYAMKAEGGGRLLVKADAATRKLLLSKMEEGRGDAREFIKKGRKKADELPLHQGLAFVYADHHLDVLTQRLVPVEEGDFLKLELRGQGVALLSLLSAASVLAVPSFIREARRAKTSEAVYMLDKIYRGAVDYFTTPRINEETYEKLACQFPAPQTITPSPKGCCGSLGGPDNNLDGRCDANPDHWTTATWSALKFQLTDPHYYVYTFDTNGKTGKEAQFTATAYGDLDCDGIWSTFQRFGKGDPQATSGECSVISAGGLFTNQEME
jgi:hypothetical protein